MPRLWIYLREHLYTELEKMAREKGVGVDDVVKQLIEDYLSGKLVMRNQVASQCDGLKQEIEQLKRRIELLEEMMRFILSALRGVR